MIKFITSRIEKPETLEERREKYKAFFIDTAVYQRYQQDVDKMLIADGFEDCIVEQNAPASSEVGSVTIGGHTDIE